MSSTSGIPCHSAPFPNDLSLVFALSVTSWEAALVGIGQTKGRELVSFFSQSLQLGLGGKGRTAPDLGDSSSACYMNRPYSLATRHLKGCREKWPSRHYSCLWALRQTQEQYTYVNFGCTLRIRRLFSI